jgi:hypothetical protein
VESEAALLSQLGAQHSFRRRNALPFRTLDGETVIVNPEHREVHVLNGTASHIWELLEDWRTLDDVVAALNDQAVDGRFDVPRSQIEQDVLQFLDQLVDKGLVSDGQLSMAAAG